MRNDGITPLRPWNNAAEMDDALVENFNNTVKENDKVYFLGDCVINRRGFQVFHRLNCKNLVLIKGNHDIFKMEDYTPFFRDIRGYHVMDKYILSHIPIHPESMGRFKGNFHGHLHANRVMMTNQYKQSVIDPRYLCVCVEQTDYRPILFERAIDKFEAQNKEI